ncbi:MAG: hypothetical protein LBU77_05950 [Clostridiales bacterium]|jgi:hypothetical protein|nr:hypothetical protein [Clostridiales bacterium]
MKLQDLIIDPRSLGSKLWLVEVSTVYEYKGKEKTDVIFGYRYTVALPEKSLEKVGVKIAGAKLLETPESFVEVKFDNLEIYLYFSNDKQPVVAAKATGISLVNHKS